MWRRSTAAVIVGGFLIVSPGGATADPPAAVASHDGCPSKPDRSGNFRLWIKVLKWCALPAPRGQQQIKLALRIRNDGRRRLDISRPRIRLIVRTFNRRRWTPPREGSPTTDRPFRTRWRGKRVWAIPPNSHRAFDYDPPPRGNLTHATHWSTTSLAPGQTLWPARRKRGVVVFYRPRHRRGGRLHGVIGVAYVAGRDIKALCPKERWGKQVPAGTF